MFKKVIFSFLLLLIKSIVLAQSHNHLDSVHRDSHYMIIDNKVKSKFWGNSWHIPIGYTVGISNDFELGLGRSYKRNFCGGAGCTFATNSWGVGYGISSKAGSLAQSVRIYYGYNFFYYPPFSAGIRGDFIYNLTNQVHYFKPSVGFSFIIGELFYSYGLKLDNGTRILPAHGFTLRINLFYPMKKWEDHHPNRC